MSVVEDANERGRRKEKKKKRKRGKGRALEGRESHEGWRLARCGIFFEVVDVRAGEGRRCVGVA